YTSGSRVSAPNIIKNTTPFSELITGETSGTHIPALIQAGRSVSISATNRFSNGVERSGIPVTTSNSKVSNTNVRQQSQTIFLLNSQLPPDLQQQQINPIALPEFNLPQGGNGLFRLSGIGGANSQTVDGAEIASGSGRQPGAHRYLIETNPE